MASKFEGFEGCFSMTINTTKSLKRLRNTNERRTKLDINIAKGTATRFNVMTQLKAELEIFDVFLKIIERKKKAKECCATINIVISTLTKRINYMWNTIFLLFAIDDEIEPELIIFPNGVIMNSCANCNCCNVTIESIMSNIEIISIQEDVIFNFSSSNYLKIIKTTTFVDKTLMIKEVFCYKESKGIVITAPRKYGKSTNLSMLKFFLEIQVDSTGKPLTKAKANKPITDTSNYELFKKLNISREANIMKKHFGKYPVLYANFKIEKCIKSYACVLNGCKEIVHKSFLLHNYLQNSSKLGISQRKLYKSWCDTSYKKLKKEEEIVIGLRLLCTCLTEHYNKACFVLIDELDFFTETVTITETLLKDYKLIILFLRQFLSFLENNNLVVKAFVTGKSGYAIHSIVPLCIKIQPFYDFHKFTDYYGFTENELEYLFKKSEFKHVQTTLKEVKAYYGSYNKFNQSTKTKTQIYCIWSILNVLKCKKLDNYWRDFGNVFCNFLNPTIKVVIQKLLANELLMVVIHNNAPRSTHPTPPPIIAASGNLTRNSLDYYFNLMLDLGYVTRCSKSITVLDFFNNTGSCIGYVSIPNQEIRHDIENKLSLLS